MRLLFHLYMALMAVLTLYILAVAGQFLETLYILYT